MLLSVSIDIEPRAGALRFYGIFVVVTEAKGTIFLSIAKFVRDHHGDEALQRCLDQLSAEDRHALSNVLAMGWYPLEPVIELHRVFDALYGDGDLRLVHEVGRFSAEWQLNAFHKFVLHFASPRWMIHKAGQLWGRYHRTGDWEVEQPDPHKLVGRLRGFAVKDACFCTREAGWFTRAVELTGGKDVRVVEPHCTARGDEYCEYVGTWRDSA